MRRALLCLLLVGCMPHAERRNVVAPDGNPAIYVTCPRSHVECHEEAMDGCPYGYEVLEHRETHGVNTYGHVMGSPAYGQSLAASSRPTFWEEMMIRCRRRPAEGRDED